MNKIYGLSSIEAKKQLLKYGKNTLPKKHFSIFKLIFRQLEGIFNLLLLFATFITFLLGENTDAIFILIFIFLGTTLNVIQEYKSNAAAEKLKSYLLRTITVCRDGKDQEIPIDLIVPGDIVKLESGDIVPADINILEATNLMVDETTFTGESVPVAKYAIKDDKINDDNRIFQGVVIVRGNATVEVVNTGLKTKLAGISLAATSIQTDSVLTKGIDRISKFILSTTAVTLVFIILANVLIEGENADLINLIVFAIALSVSVIPEALPLVITFSLSKGSLQFAKNNVLVKRLSSIQDLGSVNLLCTDKTGTITENKLAYVDSYAIPNSKFDPLVLARLAAIGLNERIPEPFDLATDKSISDDQREEVNKYKLIKEEAFEPELRSNGAIVERNDGVTLHVRRGSPEYFFEQGIINKEKVQGWLDKQEKKGHRVIGVSYNDGKETKFGGFVSFVDKLKSTTKETIKLARLMNIAITIITGDALIVASAVGKKAGLVTSDDEVMDAKTFFSMPANEQHQMVGKIRVFARTTPEQKLELIQMLKEQYTIGYLGEGINDAPALKAANVSMVVQSASDVAREVADIVLLKNDLRVIVNGIHLGRVTHANTMKYIRTTLISNFGNFYAVAIGSLFITFLPMLPKQLLLLNLLSDFPMMAIAFDRVSKEEVAKPYHYDFKSLYIIFVTLGLVSTIFDFMYFALFYRISPEVLQTNWFIASVITEILLIFSIRSMLPIRKAGLPAPIIIFLSLISLLLAIALPIIPVTADFFEFTTPTLNHLMIIVGLSFAYLFVTEMIKIPLTKFLSNNK